MGWNGNILTAAVGWGNISDATHQGGPPYTMGAMVANSNQINMWAKWKPFKYPSAGWNTTTQQGAQDRADAAASRNYGIAIPTETVLGDMTYGFLYKLYNSQLNWYYDKPTAGAPNEWFRALDFDGYMSDARVLTIPIQIVSYNLSADNSLTITWPQIPYPSGTTGQILLSDLSVNSQSLNNFYFGALIYDPNTGTWVISAPSTVATSGTSVTFSLMGAYAGRTVDIVPFLSSGQIPSGQTPGGLTLVSYNLPPISITINAHTGVWETVAANGSYNPLGTTVSYTVKVKNNNSSAGNMDVTIRLCDAADGSHVLTSTTQQIRGLAQGSQSNLTGTFSWTYDSTKSYYLAVDGTYGSGLSYEYLQWSVSQVRRPFEPVPSE